VGRCGLQAPRTVSFQTSQELIKGGNPASRFSLPRSCFLRPSSPSSSSHPLELWPPLTMMASTLPSSRFHWEDDLRKLRKVIGWQSPGFNGKLRCRIMSLSGMWSSNFVYFSTNTLFDLMLLFSSFFLTLLEHYGLQLQHLSPHSIMLVAIFVHLYEMYVCKRPSVCLFCCFHMLRFARRSSTPSAHPRQVGP
jgi:hypothetical protein